MEIDIRKSSEGRVDTIRFSDDNSFRSATKLVQHEPCSFYIEDENDDNSLRLDDRDQVENLILALQRALNMDWV